MSQRPCCPIHPHKQASAQSHTIPACSSPHRSRRRGPLCRQPCPCDRWWSWTSPSPPSASWPWSPWPSCSARALAGPRRRAKGRSSVVRRPWQTSLWWTSRRGSTTLTKMVYGEEAVVAGKAIAAAEAGTATSPCCAVCLGEYGGGDVLRVRAQLPPAVRRPVAAAAPDVPRLPLAAGAQACLDAASGANTTLMNC
jgi:hypothetical protein